MNFRKLFQNKEEEVPENRRSGEDRRHQEVPVDESKRQNEDRRELVQGYNKIIETYSKIPMFKSISNEQLLKILRICSKIKRPSAQYLFHKGEESKTMYILLRGKLNIMLEAGEVWKTVTSFGSVGEMGFFSGANRSADVITDAECILLQLNKVEVSKLFLKDKELHIKILQNVVKELTQRLLADNEEIEQLHYRIRAMDKI